MEEAISGISNIGGLFREFTLDLIFPTPIIVVCHLNTGVTTGTLRTERPLMRTNWKAIWNWFLFCPWHEDEFVI